MDTVPWTCVDACRPFGSANSSSAVSAPLAPLPAHHDCPPLVTKAMTVSRHLITTCGCGGCNTSRHVRGEARGFAGSE